MSILSDAFDGVVNFFANFGATSNAPQGGITGPPTPGQVDASGGYGYGDLAKDIFSVAAPLIATSAARPKALKLPDQPKFPAIPDSVKNDPRTQQLLAPYGLGAPGQPDNFPSIQPQKLARSSDFQLAFPAMVAAATKIVNRQFEPSTADNALQEQQARIDAAKKTPTITPTTPAQVAETTVIQATPKLMDQTINPIKANGDAIKTTSKYDNYIESSAAEFKLDPDVLRAVIHNESSGNSKAIGDGGEAIGLGQLHAGAAKDAAKYAKSREYTQDELKDPATNIRLTAAYLAKLHNDFGGASGDAKYEKTFGAYNQGAAGSTKTGSDSQAKAKQYSLKAQATLLDIKKRTGRSNVV